jgi:uncharacterized integral membrane protein
VPWLHPQMGPLSSPWGVWRAYRGGMGRILLIIAVIIVGVMLAGWIFSLLAGLLKWALILGFIAAGIYGVTLLFGSGRHRMARR